MKRKIKTNKIIIAEETEIGKGVTLMLENASRPIINLLRTRYEEDSSVISGDIDFLFEYNGKGISDDYRFFST